jgi:hypothetical protein
MFSATKGANFIGHFSSKIAITSGQIITSSQSC